MPDTNKGYKTTKEMPRREGIMYTSEEKVNTIVRKKAQQIPAKISITDIKHHRQSRECCQNS